MYPLSVCCLLVFKLQAQNPAYPVYRHSVGIGFERVGLDAPDMTGNRYLLGYARHLLKDRVVLGANLGYMSVLNERFIDGDVYVYGKPRKRVTSDLTVSFDFIRHLRHAFRIGAGPSLWYRRDEPLGGVYYTISSGGKVTLAQVEWQPVVKEYNYGFNVLIEYEYAFTERLLASAKLKFASLERAGQSSIYGVGVGYRLR
ncbi:MAG TPA: hypothetical protein VF630_01535 [Hymenobacter sp.]|jgi:hypothetical protein